MTDIDWEVAHGVACVELAKAKADNVRLTALLKEARSHVLDAGAAGLVADIDKATKRESSDK